MKNTSAVICFLLLCLPGFKGCDYSLPLRVQGNEKHFIATDCGHITLASSVYGRRIFVYHSFEGNQFAVDKVSLDIFFYPPGANAIQEVQWADENDRPVENKYILPPDKTKITLRIALKNTFEEGQVLVLPIDYVSCAGAPLMKDTIRISK